MPFLLIILMPFAMAGGCWVLRRQTSFVAVAGAATVALELVLVLRAPRDEPVRLLGTGMLLGGSAQLLLAALLLSLGSVLLGWTALRAGENAVPATLVLVGLVVTAALVQSVFTAGLLLLVGGLAGVMLILDRAGAAELPAISAALKYLLVSVLGGVLLLVGLTMSLLVPGGGSPLGLGLVVAGFGLWLGLVPFQIAPGLAEDTSLLVLAVLGGVPLIALFVFGSLLQNQTELLAHGGAKMVILAFAGLTTVAAPLVAYGGAGRAIALLLVANMGQLVLGLGLGSLAGFESVHLGAPAQALATALICIGAVLLQSPSAGRRATGQPWRDRPAAVAAVMSGLLVLLGAPPWAGFGAKARLWQAAWEHGLPLFGLVVLGHTLACLAAVRLVRGLLAAAPTTNSTSWEPVVAPVDGPEEAAPEPTVTPSYAPRPLRAWLVVLVVVALLAGLLSGRFVNGADAPAQGTRLVIPAGGGS